MKKKTLLPLSLAITSQIPPSEDIKLMNQLAKKYTQGNFFEHESQIAAMARDFGVDSCEALDWTMSGRLPTKYFTRAKELLNS